MRSQEAVAEAVNRRDPGAVQPARELVPPQLVEPGADTAGQLRGRTFRVRDHEQRVDVEPALAHGLDEALDEHGRLPGAGTGRHEHLPARVDGRGLLLVQPPALVGDDCAHARLTRHIRQRSHQAGQSPPLGSWRTSPARMRCANPCASSLAPSTRAQNASSSR